MMVSLTPAARRVVDACAAAGFRPLVVGGAVRDALLGRESHDTDLEVHGVADRAELMAALSGVGSFSEQGASFGILSARIDDEVIELSVATSATSEEGFARRDFTINAMGWDPATGELLDPFNGQRDLARGVLRHTSQHFSDDPLRVLRGVRFAGQLGFALAAETKGVCRELVVRYDEIATERVWGEWRRLARTATHWPAALAALRESGWDRHFPQLADTRSVPQNPDWHGEGDVWSHLGLAAQVAALAAEVDVLPAEDREVVVLASLLHDVGKVTHTVVGPSGIISHGHAGAGVEPANDLLRSVGAPAALIARVLPLIAEHMTHVSTNGSPSRPAVHRLMRRLSMGGATIADWARLVDADCAGRIPAKPSPAAEWLAIADSIGGAPARGLLTGAHLIERGYEPGPAFSSILRAAAEAQDDELFVDEQGALRWLDAVNAETAPAEASAVSQE